MKSSPPHSQSLTWLGETAAGGSASGVQSGQAAGRSPGTPEEEEEEEEDTLVGTTETTLEVKRQTCPAFKASHLVSHMWQVLKAHWRAEHLVMHIHDLVLVTAGVQVVHSVL